MHSRGENDPFSLCHILRILFGSYSEQLAFVTRKRFGKRLSLYILLFYWICHDHIQLILKLGVRVRVAVSKEYVVIIVLEIVGECKGVEGAEVLGTFFSYPVLVVRDLSSSSMPTDVFGSRMLFRINEDFHALVIKRVWLTEIQ